MTYNQGFRSFLHANNSQTFEQRANEEKFKNFTQFSYFVVLTNNNVHKYNQDHT